MRGKIQNVKEKCKKVKGRIGHVGKFKIDVKEETDFTKKIKIVVKD